MYQPPSRHIDRVQVLVLSHSKGPPRVSLVNNDVLLRRPGAHRGEEIVLPDQEPPLLLLPGLAFLVGCERDGCHVDVERGAEAAMRETQSGDKTTEGKRVCRFGGEGGHRALVLPVDACQPVVDLGVLEHVLVGLGEMGGRPVAGAAGTVHGGRRGVSLQVEPGEQILQRGRPRCQHHLPVGRRARPDCLRVFVSRGQPPIDQISQLSRAGDICWGLMSMAKILIASGGEDANQLLHFGRSQAAHPCFSSMSRATICHPKSGFWRDINV